MYSSIVRLINGMECDGTLASFIASNGVYKNKTSFKISVSVERASMVSIRAGWFVCVCVFGGGGR